PAPRRTAPYIIRVRAVLPRRASRLARRRLAERGLGGRQARDRHPERRARDVVEPDGIAERDRSRIAAMLAADAELEIVPRLAPALDRNLDELADAFTVERDERIDRQDALRRIGTEKARGVVAADAERGLGQIVGAEREEFRGFGDLAGEQRGARQLDHGADLIFDAFPGLLGDRGSDGVD